ncbi:hypothetical protein [Dyadobacter sp. CY345]|uniref:hypothetical protein n=1 Tax=Dyadobacter sp. CY345 TaxID=2909335 RepID=UPI001F1A005B|nr:hypothetical protein [Dyadobacter sp. CY345]
MSFVVVTDNTDSFDSIKIIQNEKLLLIIKLIDIKNWTFSLQNTANKYQDLSKSRDEIRKSGVSFVTLWEDIWLTENTIVKSRLSALLGISQRIPARMTKARRIDKPMADKFLDQNHLQHTVSAKLKYGLFLPKQYFRVLKPEFQPDLCVSEILVAVATFSHPRIFERGDKPFRSYELIRFANLLNTTVIGGFDKLLTYFEKECKPDDIMTYADLDWSDGASYRRLGFEAVSDKDPMAFWLNTETNERFPQSKITKEQHFITVYNGGSRKFVKEIVTPPLSE